MAEKLTKAKSDLTFEQIMLSEVPNATYGELIEFSRELANRINDAKSFEDTVSGELVAAVLHNWCLALEKPRG